LFRKYDTRNLTGRQYVDDAEGTLYVPDDQLLAPRYPTVNRRLRLVLDDNQGLFLCFAVRAGSQFGPPQTHQYRAWCSGGLYWRYKQ